MAWHGMAWHGMAWHGIAWHGGLGTSRRKSIDSSATPTDRARGWVECLGCVCGVVGGWWWVRCAVWGGCFDGRRVQREWAGAARRRVEEVQGGAGWPGEAAHRATQGTRGGARRRRRRHPASAWRTIAYGRIPRGSSPDAVLCCAMLCYGTLCHAVLCCAVLCCAVLCDGMPSSTACGRSAWCSRRTRRALPQAMRSPGKRGRCSRGRPRRLSTTGGVQAPRVAG